MNISAVILTYNEEPNIRRTLDSVKWIDEVIIIDSISSDTTLDIVKEYPNAKVYERKFDNHTEQWNFGLSKAKTDWVLSMDADYVIGDKLKSEIQNLDIKNAEHSGYFIPFKYCVFGKPLRGTILPPRLALFNIHHSRYIQDGHTQMLETDGKTKQLNNPILHDDRKALSRWLWAQDKYANLEYEKLKTSPRSELSFADKIRSRKYFAPFIIFFYCLIFKGGILDGKRGLFYAFQRMYVEILISIKLLNKTNK